MRCSSTTARRTCRAPKRSASPATCSPACPCCAPSSDRSPRAVELPAGGVDDTEQIALGVGKDDETGPVRVGPVDPRGPERYQAFDLGLLLQGAVGMEVKVRPVVLVQRDRNRCRVLRAQDRRRVLAVAAVLVGVPECLTPEL